MKGDLVQLEIGLEFLTTAVYALQVQSKELIKSCNESLDEYADSLLNYCSERISQITQDVQLPEHIQKENSPGLPRDNYFLVEEESALLVQVSHSNSLRNLGLREMKFIPPSVSEIIDEGSLFRFDLKFQSYELFSQFFSSLESRESIGNTHLWFADYSIGKPKVLCPKRNPKPPDISTLDWTLNAYYWTSKNVQDTCSCTSVNRIE